MPASQEPTILFVDEKQSAADALKRSIGDRGRVLPRTPDHVTERDLRAADLVLVDYDLSEWDGPASALTSPPNGFALCGVLRERLREVNSRDAKGVALYSGEVSEISDLPAQVRGYAVARLNNLEWVFEKGDREAYAGILSLAAGIRRLPLAWP